MANTIEERCRLLPNYFGPCLHLITTTGSVMMKALGCYCH